MKVLIICGHPHLEQSVANAAMLEEYKQNSDVEIRRIGVENRDSNGFICAILSLCSYLLYRYF